MCRARPAFNCARNSLDRQTQRGRALVHFEWRESVNVHVRHCAADRTTNIEIGASGEIRMDAALHADFGGAARPSFPRAL